MEGTSSPGGLKIRGEFNWKKKSSKEATSAVKKKKEPMYFHYILNS